MKQVVGILMAIAGIPFFIVFGLIDLIRLKIFHKKRRLFGLGRKGELPLIKLWKIQWEKRPIEHYKNAFAVVYKGYLLSVMEIEQGDWIYGFWEPKEKECATYEFAESETEAKYRCIEDCETWINSTKQLKAELA